MNWRKAGFFDSQAEASWACEDYTAEELAQLERMLNLGRIGEGMKVLEPGCGTGRLTRILADRVGPHGRVVALDISEKMVHACLHNLGPRHHVEALWSAVEDYVLPWHGFDAVVCHQVFPHFDDKARALSLFANTLAPWGVLVIFHFINSALINEVHRKVHTAVSDDIMPPEADMRSLLCSAGFRIHSMEDGESGYLLVAHVVH